MRKLDSVMTMSVDGDFLRFTSDLPHHCSEASDAGPVLNISLSMTCITAVDVQLIGLCEAHISTSERESEFVLAIECWGPAGNGHMACEWLVQQEGMRTDLERATLLILNFPFTAEKAAALVSIVNSIKVAKPATVGTSGIPTWMLGKHAPAFGPAWRVMLMRAKAAVSLFSAVWACWLLYQNSRQVQDALRHAHTFVLTPMLDRAEELSKPIVDLLYTMMDATVGIFLLYTEWVWKFVLPLKHILEQITRLVRLCQPLNKLMNICAVFWSCLCSLVWPLFAVLRDGFTLIWPVLVAAHHMVWFLWRSSYSLCSTVWGSPVVVAVVSLASSAGSLIWKSLSPLIYRLQVLYALFMSVGLSCVGLLGQLGQTLYMPLSALVAAVFQLATALKPAGKTLETFQAESQKQYVSIFFSGLWARSNTVAEFLAGRGQHEWHNLFEITSSPHASPPLVRRQPATHRVSGGVPPKSPVLRSSTPQRRRSLRRLTSPTGNTPTLNAGRSSGSSRLLY
jgi:hypothetical protein